MRSGAATCGRASASSSTSRQRRSGAGRARARSSAARRGGERQPRTSARGCRGSASARRRALGERAVELDAGAEQQHVPLERRQRRTPSRARPSGDSAASGGGGGRGRVEPPARRSATARRGALSAVVAVLGQRRALTRPSPSACVAAARSSSSALSAPSTCAPGRVYVAHGGDRDRRVEAERIGLARARERVEREGAGLAPAAGRRARSGASEACWRRPTGAVGRDAGVRRAPSSGRRRRCAGAGRTTATFDSSPMRRAGGGAPMGTVWTTWTAWTPARRPAGSATTRRSGSPPDRGRARPRRSGRSRRSARSLLPTTSAVGARLASSSTESTIGWRSGTPYRRRSRTGSGGARRRALDQDDRRLVARPRARTGPEEADQSFERSSSVERQLRRTSRARPGGRGSTARGASAGRSARRRAGRDHVGDRVARQHRRRVQSAAIASRAAAAARARSSLVDVSR